MKNLLLLLVTILSFLSNAQQSEKYTTNAKGKIQVINGLNTTTVTWTFTNYILNNTDTTRFFFLPISRLYDISASGGSNGIYGMRIASKDNLIKFAESLIYLGKQNGRKSEKLIIDKFNNIELSLFSTLPKYVSIGNSGGFYLTKGNAVKLGNTILKNIIYF